jgi:putative ABC transport system ATP-binding protein
MVKLTNISKTFNPFTITEKRAVHDVSLELRDGDFVTVIGGNGAGKSTLLNLIAGVYPMDSGTIALDGVDVSAWAEHRRARFLSRVFQDPMMGTAATMEIEENLALAYRRGKRRGLAWGINDTERTLYTERLADLGLGLETRLHTKVGLLSGGQRQALTLLMAGIQKPKLLLLDEHTAALDPKTAARVLELTEEIIAKDRLTAFMVTHDMRYAIRYGNRLIMMLEGEIIYDVSGAEKQSLQVSDLLQKFQAVSGAELSNDRMLLSGG